MSLKGYLSRNLLCVFHVIIICMVIVTVLWSPQIHANGLIRKITSKPLPSLPGKPITYTERYACYSGYTGRPINCKFTHKINGLATPETDPNNNGGHFHYTSRPLSRNNKPLLHSGDFDPTPYGVIGFTALSSTQAYGKVEFESPEVSGSLDLEATVTLPPGWICAGGCYTINSWRYEKTYDIGIRDLVTLPALPSTYIKVRTLPDNDHPNSVAFNGTRFTLQMLPIVAQDYYILSGRLLSINDMSLPKGGLFDINANWSTPHKTHREGKDADINQDNNACYLDLDLRTAIDQLLRKVKRNEILYSALLCEPCQNGTLCRKHIDLEFP